MKESHTISKRICHHLDPESPDNKGNDMDGEGKEDNKRAKIFEGDDRGLIKSEVQEPYEKDGADPN
jgi:hypothetical protein